MKKDIKEIARLDGRYAPQALKFVYEGLGYTINRLADSDFTAKHISGTELCDGLRQKALERWGRLAAMVLNHWGIRTTRDFGEIVYLMIEHKWMSAQPHDSIDDFNDIYDFRKAFEDEFEFEDFSETAQ
ncbi:MAG: Minf_1886 family protein [Planctomycetota bacterium]